MFFDAISGLLRKLLNLFGLSPKSKEPVRKSLYEAPQPVVDLETHENDDEIANFQPLEFPYHLRDNFLTPAELSFYSVLRTVVENRAVLCAKVSLGDLFWVKKDDPSRYRIYTNKIDRKHVDFVLCDSATMRPLVGIELDDKSHERADRRSRDEFVDKVFAAAGLPLLHVPVKRAYMAAELNELLAPYLGTKLDTPVVPSQQRVAVPLSLTPSGEAEAPICPKCGSAMVLRTAKSGANSGNRFWGCSKYPNCRSMLPYTP